MPVKPPPVEVTR